MKNLSFVTVADLQLRLQYKESRRITQPLYEIEGTWDLRLIDHFNNLDQSIEFAIENKVNFFVIAGDVFEHVNAPEKLKTLFIKSIAPLIKNRIQVFVLLGNHDVDGTNYNLDSEAEIISQLSIEEPLSNYLQIIKRSWVYCEGDIKIVMLSWLMNNEEDVKQILSGTYAKDCIIFGHLEISNAVLGNHEYRLGTGLNPVLFQNHKCVYLGHFHKHHKIDTGKGYITYVGSIAREGFSEKDEQKGFLYSQLTETNELKEIFIQVNDRPYIELTITETDNIFNRIESELKKDCIAKLVFFGKKTWIQSLDLKTIKSYALKKIEVVKIILDKKIIKETETKATLNNNASFHDWVNLAAKEDNIPRELKEFGINVLNKAMEGKI